MKPLLIIRALAVALIALFTLGTFGAGYVIFTSGFSLLLMFAIATNIGFIIAGIGLFRVRRWSWWLTLGLCVISIIQLLWQIFTKLTPETATNQNQMVSYVVAGFYLAIGFVLTSDSVRKTFREYGTAA